MLSYSKTEIKSIDICTIDKGIITSDTENLYHQVDDVKVEDADEDVPGNNIVLNTADQDKYLEFGLDGEHFTSGLDIEAESLYSTTDVEPNSTEESDIDISYRRFEYSPTGYTTSEIDTTDLRDLDETTETADIDTTGLTDYDTTGIEGGGEDLSILDDGTEINNIYDSEEHEEAGTNGTMDDIAEQVVVIDENCNIENIDMLITSKESKEGCEVSLADCKPLDDSIDQGKHLFPSVSDTTYPSTFTSISDFTFTSAYDTSQTDSDLTYEGSNDKRLDVFDEKVVVQYIEKAETSDEGRVVEIAHEECSDKEEQYAETNDNVEETNNCPVPCSDIYVENDIHTQIRDFELENETQVNGAEIVYDENISAVTVKDFKEVNEPAESEGLNDDATVKPPVSELVGGAGIERIEAKDKKDNCETYLDVDVVPQHSSITLENKTDVQSKEFEDLSRRNTDVCSIDFRTDACELTANVCDVCDGVGADPENVYKMEVLSIIDSLCSIVVEQFDSKTETESKKCVKSSCFDASDRVFDMKESDCRYENLLDDDTFHIAFEEIQNGVDVNTVYMEEIIIPNDEENQSDALRPVHDVNDCPNPEANRGISVQESDTDTQDILDNSQCIISLDIPIDREENEFDRKDIEYGDDLEDKTTEERKFGEEIESESVNVVFINNSHEKFENTGNNIEEYRQNDEEENNLDEISKGVELHQIYDRFDESENIGKELSIITEKISGSKNECRNEEGSGQIDKTNILTSVVEENVPQSSHSDSVAIKDEESIEKDIYENTSCSDYSKEELGELEKSCSYFKHGFA